ncbi:uncharacterized protein LOC142421322 [Mycteria americana]|uniref:uncharacterized protein LOC142421322 n=1 Tax=Mycteria americana TaxID=33587 RepID=UPI003F58827F
MGSTSPRRDPGVRRGDVDKIIGSPSLGRHPVVQDEPQKEGVDPKRWDLTPPKKVLSPDWVLCHLLSHLPPTEGDDTAECGLHSCSTESCCLGEGISGAQHGPWVCGCPPGMAPTPLYQNSSTITCQAFGPSPKSTCNIPILEEAMKACKDLKTPTCTRLENTRKQLEAACTQPTKGELQTVLGNLQTDALKNRHHPNTTELLLQSTEALVVQAALKGPGSGPQNFSTSIMDATVEVVRDNCSQDTLVLAVGEQNLAITCREVLNNTETGKYAVAFIVYKEVEQLLGGTTNLPKARLNSPVVGGTTGKPGVTFNVPFNITLQHLKVHASLP